MILFAATGAYSSSTERVPQEQVDGLRLLDCKRLPANASNVWLHEENALDAYQAIRFDTSLQDARALATALLGHAPVRGDIPDAATDFGWWPTAFPGNAEGGSDDSLAPGEAAHGPALHVVLVPRGTNATIWINEFENPAWRAQPCDVKRFPFA